MKKIFITAVLGVFMSCQFASAQQEVIVIDKNNYRRTKEKTPPKRTENTSVLKFSPLQMIAGEINLGYERQINKKSSFEVELGPTISRIGFISVGHVIVDPFSTSFVSESSGLGFFASAGYRFYPLDETEALNRLYVSPVLKYRLYNVGYNDGAGVLGARKGNDLQANFVFNVGYQWWVAKSFSFDFFMGMGIGYRDIRSYSILSSWDGNTGMYESSWTENSASGARYVFNAGIKMGIGKE